MFLTGFINPVKKFFKTITGNSESSVTKSEAATSEPAPTAESKPEPVTAHAVASKLAGTKLEKANAEFTLDAANGKSIIEKKVASVSKDELARDAAKAKEIDGTAFSVLPNVTKLREAVAKCVDGYLNLPASMDNEAVVGALVLMKEAIARGFGKVAVVVASKLEFTAA